MALTDIRARTIKPSDRPFKLTDGQGMHLLINLNGSRYWRLQYRFGDRQKVSILGVYPMVPLGEARRKRDEAKKLISVGINPSEKKEADKIEQSEALAFEAVARDWYTAYKRKWSDSHSERVLKSMEDGLFTTTGKRKISELSTKDLLVPIKAVEVSGRLEVTSRPQQRAMVVMRRVVQNGLTDYNPAQEMVGTIAAAERIHRLALPLERSSELLERIGNFKGRKLAELAVKLTSLIFIRSNELRFARWSEIDSGNAVWTTPGKREPLPGVKHSRRGSKMRTSHLVSLSRQALEFLKAIREISGECDLVFTGDHDFRKPMSENTVNKALGLMGYGTTVEVCGHGFRATACSALIESGKWSRDAVERQMSYQGRNSVRAAYIHKAEHLDKRGLMLQQWADHLDETTERRIAPFDFDNQLILISKMVCSIKN